MKKIYLALVLSMLVAPAAYANNDNKNACGNNGNNCNLGGAGGQGGLGGTATNTVGSLSTGASTSSVGNIQNNSAGGAASAGNVGNVGSFSTVKNLSPEATANSTNVNTNTNTSVNTNANTSVNTNVNGQQQGQQQGQGQGQTQSANNEGNTQTINIAAPKTYRPPVNSAIAPTIFPTAPCMGSSSVGATGTLFSISGGTTWTSEECMILETARSFDQAGYAEDGLSVRCQGKWAKNAPSCKALAADAKQASALKTVKQATAPVVAKPTQRQAEVTIEKASFDAVTYSDNGYYSTVTNPLAQ